MPLDNVWLNRYTGLRAAAARQGIPFPGPADPVAFCRNFIARAHEFKVGQYREGRPFSEYEAKLLARFRPPGPPPKECAGLPKDEWVDVQDNEFSLFGEGKWVEIVDDAKASDGKAARMPSNHTQWAIQYPIGTDFSGFGAAHCYVVARCEAKAKTGAAFQAGLYDGKNKKPVSQIEPTIEQAAGATYHTFDLGVHELTPGMYLWVAPLGKPDDVDAVFVDRIFWMKAKQP